MVKLTLYEKVFGDVDDGIYALVKKVQKKYRLSWVKARDMVNKSVKEMYGG
jgi:hypothetical protein